LILSYVMKITDIPGTYPWFVLLIANLFLTQLICLDLVRWGTAVPGSSIDVSNKESAKKEALPKQSTQYLDHDAVMGIDAMWSRRQQQHPGKMVGSQLGTHQEKQFYDSERRDLNSLWERHRDRKIQQNQPSINLSKGDEIIHSFPSKGEDQEEESDISILVYQTIKTSESQSTISFHSDEKQKKILPKRHGIERYYIQERKGRISYTTSKISGSVHICVQSKRASPQYPSRAGIEVQYDFYRRQQQQLLMSLVDTLTYMRKDQVQTMLKEADYTKTLEVAFHAQSVQFSGAVIRYSVVRILCLILIAIVQLQFLLHFFNKKRLT
jgi:hypothetical protein